MKKKSRKKSLRRVVCLFLMVSIVMVFSGCGVLGVASLKDLFKERSVKEWTENLADSVQKFTDKVKNALEKDGFVLALPNHYQVLLVGSDRRERNWSGNSDAILVLSIDQTEKTVALVSFMRDLGVTIADEGYGKINSSFAKGDGVLLKRTLEQNFQITINNYIATDFWGMAHIVDLFGGTDLDISDPEIPIINEYAGEIAELEGKNREEYYLSAAGMQHLNGIQTVGYMRDRYIGNGDFERTARHRRVMEQLASKAKNMSLSELLTIAEAASKEVWHDLSLERVAGLAQVAANFSEYTFIMERVPYDGLYTYESENIDPYWAETIERVHEILR